MEKEIPIEAIIGGKIDVLTDDAEKRELAEKGIEAARQIHQKLTDEFRSLFPDVKWGRGGLQLKLEDGEISYEITFVNSSELSCLDGRTCKKGRGDIVLIREGLVKNENGFLHKTIEINENGSFYEGVSVIAPDGHTAHTDSYSVNDRKETGKFEIKHNESNIKGSPFPIEHTFKDAISCVTDLKEALQKRECTLNVGKPVDWEVKWEVGPKSKKWGPETGK